MKLKKELNLYRNKTDIPPADLNRISVWIEIELTLSITEDVFGERFVI